MVDEAGNAADSAAETADRRGPLAGLTVAGRDGAWMHAFASRLYPLLRSITGAGQRATLAAIGDQVPLRTTAVASGEQVLDWTVPQEWVVRDAWVKGPDGRFVLRLGDHTLHLLGYSAPVHAIMGFDELREHVHTLPDAPDLIPWRTSYYERRWGLCMRHRELAALPEGDYEVHIDTELVDGALVYGESVVPGLSDCEVLLSAHTCHPSLANDNLAGIAVATLLARRLHAAAAAGRRPRHSYRFVFAPGTVGAICWLARNDERVSRTGQVVAGLTLACLGDRGRVTYKRSRRGDRLVDRAAEHVLSRRAEPGRVVAFTPYGYDERQYCSPGYDLPVGSLTRTPGGEYPEYHTSADDLDFISAEQLADSLLTAAAILDVVDRDVTWRNLSPKGEPQLGRRGLYPTMGGQRAQDETMANLWVLSGSDGSTSLLDIAERSQMAFAELADAAQRLSGAGLLAPVEPNGLIEPAESVGGVGPVDPTRVCTP